MPTAGTHITILQRLADSDPGLSALLGDLHAQAGPEAIKARFANLGAVGPDMFYMLGDYKTVGPEMQALEDFLVQAAGTFECMATAFAKVNQIVEGVLPQPVQQLIDETTTTMGLYSSALNTWLLDVIATGGTNLLFWMKPPRQKNGPPTEWFWADYLHYVYTGRFTTNLIANAEQTQNEFLIAYAYGYLTHYVTDTVGHPYVNQCVGGPWRDYWQRHHLVENFIDGYVWDRWHVPVPKDPNVAEAPLDALVGAANAMGAGAPYVNSRLNDHIAVGNSTLPDWLDELVGGICTTINAGEQAIQSALGEKLPRANEPQESQADFVELCKLLHRTLDDTYGKGTHPKLLPNDGLPTPDDIAGAYGALCAIFRMTTELSIGAPEIPDVGDDLWNAFQELLDDAAGLFSWNPSLDLDPGGSFSWAALMSAISETFQDLGDLAGKVAQVLGDVGALAAFPAEEVARVAFWTIQSLLYTMYRTLRWTLVVNAYAVPYTDELEHGASFGGGIGAAGMLGDGDARSFWQVDNHPGAFPAEETLSEERIFGGYRPYIRPGPAPLELPSTNAGPYTPAAGATTLPDAFIDADLGKHDMFTLDPMKGGPQTATDQGGAGHTFTSDPRDFGGAIANCTRAIAAFRAAQLPAGFVLPDYNLDGDRGYAWPCWNRTLDAGATDLDPGQVVPPGAQVMIHAEVFAP